MNGAKYLDLFRDESNTHMEMHDGNIFMHDSAPNQRFKLMKNYRYFQQKSVDVLV